MYVKITIIYKITSDLDAYSDHIEDMWIEVTDVINKFFLVGALYSHRSNNIKHF